MQAELTEEERSRTPAFVGIGTCGHVVCCAVDAPEYAKDNAKHVASWMRSGLRIEKMSVAEVRVAEWCKCERKKKRK